MLGKITEFFESHFASVETENEENAKDQLKLASAALMIELCKADNNIDEEETNKLVDILEQKYQLPHEDLQQLIELAEEEVRNATSLYQFTSLMNDSFEYEDKVQLLENMWEVAFADGKVDRYEDHLIRKVADLLYVSHSDFIRAKLAVKNAFHET